MRSTAAAGQGVQGWHAVACGSGLTMLLQAMVTLFELATLDNWGDALTSCMNIVGHDMQPRQAASWANAFFYIIFVLVSANLIIKSFIGIFTDQVGTGPGQVFAAQDHAGVLRCKAAACVCAWLPACNASDGGQLLPPCSNGFP